MSSVSHTNCIQKSLSLESLHEYTSLQEPILTSTTNQEHISCNIHNNHRRRAMLPTLNNPNTIQPAQNMNNNDNEDDFPTTQQQATNNDQDELDNKNLPQPETNIPYDHPAEQTRTDDKNYDVSTISKVIPHSLDLNPDAHSQEKEREEKNKFDTFILQHFVPFSGKQDVNQWLDKTENQFNQFKISRTQRFEAISLLVTGEAKRCYIKYRTDILSFDDFYGFLMSQYTVETSYPISSQSGHVMNNRDLTNLPHETKSMPIPNEKLSDNSEIIHNHHQPSSIRRTNVGGIGATNSIGVIPDTTSTTVISDTSINIFDQTTNDLRKAIVGDIIKNPKVFRGAKDDVQKWIEDIEHLFDIAHIPDLNRLDLISYLLRGDASQ